jgi:hypothetical protein
MDLPPDTSNPLLVSVVLSRPIRKIGMMFGIGCLKSVDTKNRHNVWYRPLKWADTNIVIFGSGPLN